MYPEQIGIADFGAVVIKCFQVHESDTGKFSHYSFKFQGVTSTYAEICLMLKNDYPTIASLLITLGREKFLESVLEWDPSKASTKTNFYEFLADELNRTGTWDK
jgi:hypothetical protein